MSEHSFDLARFLRDVPLFAGLPREHCEQIAALFVQKQYEPSEIIFREGDPSDQIFIIVTGQVTVLRAGDDGEQVKLATLGRKQHFGDMGLLDAVTRSATVQVGQRRALLLSLSQIEFFELLRSNIEIAIRMIGAQNSRLRELGERLVVTDSAARKHAPSQADSITRTYPHPIALVFEEFDATSDKPTKLRRLLELVEVILLYASALAKSCYLTTGVREPRVDAEILSGQASCTLGYSQRLIRVIVDNLETKEQVGLPKDLCEWFTPKRSKKKIPALFEQLTELRNMLKHGSEAALDEVASEGYLREYEPKIMELLTSIKFTCKYPLVRISSMGYEEGAYHYTLKLCMGASSSFRSDAFTHDRPLETQRLYALDRVRNTVWPIFPWMGLYRCEQCGDMDIFLTTVWSPNRLACVEFGRGHRYSPKEVPASVGRMVKLLESGIRGTDFENRR